jgi:hypothetical protein
VEEVGFRPDNLGVLFERQVPISCKADFFKFELIIPEQVKGLVKAMFTPGVDRG